MAIYHLTAKTVSRGASVTAAVRSDYIERCGRYASDHAELLHKEHGNMPAWASDAPRNYWEAADAHERANGRLFKQLEFALPKELSPEQQTALAASFCREMAQTKDGPLPYSFAVHKGHDKENPHCHLLISERVNDGVNRAPDLWFKRAAKDPEKGGAKKTNELRPREWLLQCRELWAELANHALRLAGHEARIDHRTLEAQGIARAPTTHLGPSVAAMERKGIRTERGTRNRQREEAVLKPLPQAIPKPVPAPTVEECQAVLLALAKQEPGKIDSHYRDQIKPYMEYFAEADNKAEAFAFCRERMEADMTIEAARLKEMGRELSERLRRFGGTWSTQSALQQEAMNHIRTALDREQAFATITGEMDMALGRSRGLSR
ncbi:MAG: MobA/MobL family protein [Desulfovibrionaceae bacterium]|nr:MobA/MobL family protein [Desulfovibrionaceae bacterium]